MVRSLVAVRGVLRWTGHGVAIGAAAGAAHGVLGGLVTLVVNGDGIEEDFGQILFFLATAGAIVGLGVAVVIAVVTAPVVLHAVRSEGWGTWRLPIIAVPSLALVLLAFAIEPVWPADEDGGRSVDALVMRLVWLHAGPACWAVVALAHVTRRWKSAPDVGGPMPERRSPRWM